MNIIVADSGPLIALAWLECLHLPKSLWGRLLAPQSVLSECLASSRKPGASLIQRALLDGLIEEVADVAVDDDIRVFGLDPGEAQAVAIARHMQAGLLIDELRGRRTASQLSIPHIGTCGLLVQAKRKGLVTEVAPLLAVLADAGYFLAPALVRDTLRLAGESG